MLSSKKSEVGVAEIEFLGMHFKNNQYSPGPHIAQELLNFPDDNLSPKQVQQFLGIVNYLRDFIPHVSHHTSQLSKMLKKSPPPWGPSQTNAVQILKRITQNPPPLKIPDQGERILQTDASDDFWGAVLLEEVNGTRYYCGHASGQFREPEKHYHATYKEILAVKRGIEKFSFHLSPYHFIVEMDNTSFPKMLDPKKKILPDAQLLRWKDWFSRYKFTVRHLKGHHNTIADFLSRPQKTSTPPKILFTEPLYILTLSDTFHTRTMAHCQKATFFPPNTHPLQTQDEFVSYAKENLYHWLHLLFVKTDLIPTAQHFSLTTPYTTLPFIQGPIPEELLWYIWSSSILYTTAIALAPLPVYHYLCDRNNQDSPLHKLLELFAPLPYWRGTLYKKISEHDLWKIGKRKQKRFSCIFFLSRSYFLTHDGEPYMKSYANPWHSLFDWVRQDATALQEIGDHLASINHQETRQCRLLGPIPVEGYGYGDLYAPQPSYSSCSAYPPQDPSQPFNSPSDVDPTDPVFQDSQDPYAGYSQLNLSLGLPDTQPNPLRSLLSQEYPFYCTQPPTYEDPPPDPDRPPSPDPCDEYGPDPLWYVRETMYDPDCDNLSPNDDHEPIIKRD